tara:strand:- start:659 stop:787 length:129 start_codon:yes stop_codon:yes gene_type:complete
MQEITNTNLTLYKQILKIKEIGQKDLSESTILFLSPGETLSQ